MQITRKYSQNDSRWKNILLGFNTDSKYTIGNYGCLITCLAMVSSYYGEENTPLEINDKLKAKNGFVSDGLYIWNAIEKILDIKENSFVTPTLLTDIQMNDIKTQIDNGYPVMLCIDAVPSTSALDMHFVLATAYNPSDENDFTIVDPWDGQEKSLKKYLGFLKPSARKTIERYTVYIGNVPQFSNLQETKITWDDFEGKRKTVAWYVYEWGLEKQTALKEIEKRKDIEANYSEYKEKVNQVIADKDTVYNEMTLSLNKIISEREKSILSLKSNLEKANNEIDSLNDKIEELMETEEYSVEDSFKLLYQAIKKDLIELIEKLKGGEK